jgi:hypothetical protein
MQVTAELLKKLVNYDELSGEMYWLNRPVEMFKTKSAYLGWNKRMVGKKAITTDGKGYLVVSIFCKRYLVHRLIWLYVYGKFPKIIDHINGIRTDNRLINLQEVTSQQNHMNQKRSSKNTSGVTGVYLHKKRNLWCAQMKFNGNTYHIGSSKNFNDAVSMRKNEEKRLGFSERHGNAI